MSKTAGHTATRLDSACPTCGAAPGFPCTFTPLGMTPRDFGRQVDGRYHRTRKVPKAADILNTADLRDALRNLLAELRWVDMTIISERHGYTNMHTLEGRIDEAERALEESNANHIVTAVNSHASNLRKVEALRDALRQFVDHGYCPNCGCDLWNTKGCPTCPAMRSAYDALVELGEKPPRVYAEYMDADPANKLNMGMLTVVTDYINALSDSRIHNGQKERLELAEQTLRHAAERALALAEEQPNETAG